MNKEFQQKQIKYTIHDCDRTMPRCLIGCKEILILLLLVAISFPVSAQAITSSKILLSFSKPVSRENIFDPANYEVTANKSIPVEVIKVGLVKGDSAVVLFFDKDEEWISFQITVHNLKDKAGNLISAENNHAKIETELAWNTSVKLSGDK